MVLMMLVGTSSVWAANITSGTKLYLTPNSNWKTDNARFAAYFFGDGEAWGSMTLVSGETDVYEVTTPNSGKNYTNVIFCRMNPSASANNWNNKWNQTDDLTIDNTGNNQYTVKEGTWNNGGGTWSCYDNVTEYTVSGTGSTVKLSNSEKWVTYTLYNGDDKVNNTDKKGDDNGGELSWTVIESGTYKVKATNGGCTTKDMSGSYTYNPYTLPSVSTISAEVDGDNLVCKGKITSMGSATKVVWAFTVLNDENISKADEDWKYPKNQNQITAANTEFTHTIPISSLSLTNGNTYYVRAMTVDLNKTGYSSGQYGNAVAGDAISFEYDPCIELPNDAYSLESLSADWTGENITPIINKADNSYPIPTITYNGSPTLPKNVGDYTVVAKVSDNTTYCDKTFELGMFSIICPAPAEVPTYSITQQTTSCKGTDNKIGIIRITNYNDAYTYQLNGEAVTVTNNQITGLAAGSYTISAAKTCGSAKSESKSGTSVTISSTDLTPALSKVIEISGDNEICAGETTVLTCNVEASKGRIDSYTWNQTGTLDDNTITTQALNTTTSYIATVTITNDGCSKDFSNEQAYQVTVNPVPSFTTEPSNVTLCSNATAISVANLINESGAIADNSATIKLYAENEVEITEPIDINVNTQTTTTYKLKASTQACSSEFKTFTLTVNPIPSAPALTSPAPICEGGTINLPTEGLKWYNASTGGNVVSNTAITATGTYWAAAVQNECESATRTRYDITVNPLPTISIEKTEPGTIYKYADVKLKANGDNISTVVWNKDKGTITRQPNYPDETKRAMLTYDQAGTVTVTATATSEAGCSATSSAFQVEFGEEDCEPVVDMTKIYLDVTNNTGFITGSNAYVTVTYSTNKSANCDDTSGANQGSYEPQKDTWWGQMTKVSGKNNIYEITIHNSVDIGTTKLSFWNTNTNKSYDKVWEVQAILGTTTAIGKNCLKLDSKTKTHNNDRSSDFYCGTWTTYKNEVTKTTPTIKTVSVTSNEDGEVTLNGMVVTTGCNDQAKLGLQYKKQNQDGTWPDAYSTVEPNTKEDISKGKTYTTTVTLEDGTYKVRACAHVDNTLKGYGYDIIIIVSTVKTPVSEAVIYYSNMGGATSGGDEGELNPNPVCKGSKAYIKLSYQGSQLDEIQWLVDGVVVENKIEQTSTTDLFVFTVSGTETISARLKNEANEGEWVETNVLEYTMAPEPVSPTISFDKGTICSGNTASLILSSVKVGQSYQLFKQIENDGVYTDERVDDVTLVCTVDNEELKFTGLNESGKYFVKAYNAECTNLLVPSQTATLDVINSADLKISIVPTATETTPWMPVKLTVEASGDYTITSTPNDAVINKISNNTYKVKLPLPADANKGEDNTVNNVTFSDVNYRVEATLISVTGEAQECVESAKSTITLKQYIEPCTQK